MLTGITYKIISAFCFTLMAALIRWIGPDVPSGQVVFARSAFALIPILGFLAWNGDIRGAMRTPRPFGHFIRAAIGVSAMYCMFAGLARLPLPDATMISYAVPVFTIVLAVLILREPVQKVRVAAVFVGLGGVAIMLWPHVSGGQLGEVMAGRGGTAAAGALFALAGAALTSGAMIQVRRLVQTEATGTVVFYFTVFSTLFGLTSIPFGWVMPDATQAAALVAIGLIGGVGQTFLTQGYRHAEASVIAPFEYTTLVWSLGIGWLAFGDLPDVFAIVGGVVVVASGIAVIVHERRLGIERKRARQAGPPPV